MAHRKKSDATKALGLATAWMPPPLADFFSTPLGAILLFVGGPFLLATGVITVTWNNGTPTVTFDRERAVVVGREVEEKVETELETEAKLAADRLREGRQAQPLEQAAQPAQPAWR